MLKLIELTNFKCLKHAPIKLGQITVFIGANGSGKSSVAQALLILKQSIGRDTLLLDGPYISLGSFDDLVNIEAEEKEIKIKIEGAYHTGREISSNLSAKNVKFSYKMIFDDESLIRHDVKLEGIIKPISYQGKADHLKITCGWEKILSEGKAVPSEFKKFGAHINFSGYNTIGRPITTTGGGNDATEKGKKEYKYLYKFFRGLLSVIENTLRDTYFIPGIRGIDMPSIGLTKQPVTDLVSSAGQSKQSLNLIGTLGYKPEIADKISTWTKRLLGSEVRQRLIPVTRQGVEVIRNNLRTNIVNEGLGLNQLIFPLTQIAMSPPNSFVMIEEPELHLHPKAQSEIVDIFVEASKEENKQILLITHSEHILFRLLTKVAKGELSPNDLVVNYFERENISAKVKKLKVDEGGSLKGGLPGFFEAEIDEFQDYLKALTSKREQK